MTQSVSQIVMEKFGVEITPGAKSKCPFCAHKTFSIKHDDTLGKCFHPNCGQFITTIAHDKRLKRELHSVLKKIYFDFHRELLDQDNDCSKNAHDYLVQEREIHPTVVADSLLGVIPNNYDIDSQFKPLIEVAEAAVEQVKESRGEKKGRPPKTEGPSPEDLLDIIVKTQEKLVNCVRGHAGWIAFFYTDVHHDIVAIRFREPYSKRIVYFKPFKASGLFGHGLFTPYQSENQKELNDYLIVTEGEFNQLQLQSLCIRFGEMTDQEMGYLFACAVGGIGNADHETIHRIARHPALCYDNDISGAGFALVERARDTMSVTAFTTPGSDSDLDDYICSFGENYQSAWESVKALITNRETYPRTFESVASQICAVRRNRRGTDSRREFEIHTEVSKIICEDLDNRGNFYNDRNSTYFFIHSKRKLLVIHPECEEFVLLLSNFGINPSEKIFQYLFEDLRIYALKNGTKTSVYRLAYYDSVRFTLYVFNYDNQIYRISPKTMDVVDNGTDGVLFLNDPSAQPFHVELPIRLTGGSWLDGLIFSKIKFSTNGPSAKQQSLILLLWFLSLFFESIMPTKPILAFIGPQGAGKSITFRKIGKLLHGEEFNVTQLTGDSKDFDAAVTNSAFVALDNVDDKCHWLNDRLATVSTGGLIKKRVLYTTNKLIEIQTHCFLAINSRSPHFRRGDVADRLLIINVERYQSFQKEGRYLDELIKSRSLIWHEVLSYLQEVIQALQTHQDYIVNGNFRMADFYDFAIKIARSAGFEEEVRSIFDLLTSEQSYFMLEGDHIFELLTKWAAEEQNQGHEVTNADLCKELADLADKEKLNFVYKGNVRSFAQRMNNLRPNLEKFFVINSRSGGGRKMYLTFKPKSDINQDQG